MNSDLLFAEHVRTSTTGDGRRCGVVHGEVRKSLDTPEKRALWAEVERASETVRQWPAWKRGLR